MPELPEVEVVRRGLERWAALRCVDEVEVLDPRSLRRHAAGPDDLAVRLRGRRLGHASRRGKFLWFRLDGDEALVAHLGMSGQLLIAGAGAPDERHLRVRFRLGAGGDARARPSGARAGEARELRFVDQRLFGGLMLDPLVPDEAGGLVPASVAHIARDPLDPEFDDGRFSRALRRRQSGIKRSLLDQGLVSGIGNIYADEALWRSRLHYDTPSSALSSARVRELLGHAREVMAEALAEGGTSFDSLYVNVNGESGYFARGLAAYGREGEPCERCGTPLRREPFMNRSSFRCPRCQRAPRLRRNPSR